MKQLISDWVLTSEPELRVQASLSLAVHVEPAVGSALTPSPAIGGLCADTNMLPDESKLLLLTHLYLELRLNLKDALRAAQADIIMAPKGQNRRLWVEQRQ